MTYSSRALCCALAASSIFIGASTAFAQAATEAVLVQEIGGDSNVTEGNYYTQVQLNIGELRLPTDDNGKKNYGRALLSVLGLDKKTRAITVTATLSTDGLTMPEVPLITYYFDGSRRLTDHAVTDGYLSPRWNLPPGTPIVLTLRYRYVENTQYNPNFLKDSVGKLIPSSTVVQTLSGPFVGGVSDLATSVFKAAGSRDVNISQTHPLYPYANGAIGSRSLKYTLQAPGRGNIGTINAVMLVAPSLGRSPIPLAGTDASTLKYKTGDDAGALSLRIQGQEFKLLDEIKSLPAYTELKNAVARETVSTFCNAARSESNDFGLTRMDRNNLILRAMQDASFTPGVYREDVNDWMRVCFNAPADQEYLKQYRSINFALPADPTPPEVDPTFWPLELRWAMGCQMRREVGPLCRSNAPDAPGALASSMAETVQIGFVALPTIEATIPDNRMAPKEALIETLSNKVDAFGCFAKSLVLTDEGKQYFLNVKYDGGNITELSILKAADDFFCTG